jgi:dTDP-4-dehydrorhamnose reductase
MRAIVTGATGFLGGRLAAMLAADPRLSAVTGLDRAAPPANGPVRVIQAEIARFPEVAPGAEVVVHAAAITSQASEADPEAAFAINVEGMRAVLRWARAQPSPPRVLLLSSIAVFGRGDAVAVEDTPPDPRSSYGTTKLIAERLLLDATRRGEADGVILRLPVSIIRTATRAAPPGAGFVSDLIDAALRRRPFTVPLAADHAVPVATSRPWPARRIRSAAHWPPVACPRRISPACPTRRWSDSWPAGPRDSARSIPAFLPTSPMQDWSRSSAPMPPGLPWPRHESAAGSSRNRRRESHPERERPDQRPFARALRAA